MTNLNGSTTKGADIHVLHKEWDEISCPICMEHPHNAVLLICSSHEKGCRSYICDTSYRHSNCLDRFRKMRMNLVQEISSLHENFNQESSDQNNSNTVMHDPIFSGSVMRRNSMETHEDYTTEENSDELPAGLFAAPEANNHIHLAGSSSGAEVEERVTHEGSLKELNCLKCPLCRGTVMGWMIIKEERQYWNLKPRTCSRESCSFSGNYRELRKHARDVHPTTRPADVDPTRLRAWRHLEHQQEHDDILSAIRSAMPGAIVMGDYVLDNHESTATGEGSRPLWTTFLLLHILSPIGALEELTGSPRPLRRRRRPSRGNHLWGENLLGLRYDDDDDEDDENPEDDDFPIPRRRRRITRSRTDEDNS